MPGFWVKTADGNPVHINGRRDMPPETVGAILEALEQATKQCWCLDNQSTKVYQSVWGHYQFAVMRCNECGNAYVIVTGDNNLYLGRARTWVAPFDESEPGAGNAYHWRFYGINHKTGAIVPVESEAAS